MRKLIAVNTIVIGELILFGTGCYSKAYYISPHYGTSTSYHSMPSQNDSIKASLYVNGTFSTGATNYNLRDGILEFQGNIYRAHQIGRFKGFYGIGGSLGNYNVGSFKDEILFPSYLDTGTINRQSGNYFYSSVAFAGGANICTPIGNRGGEWRVIGMEVTLNNEFGDYLGFRRRLNADSVSGLITSNFLSSFSLSTELVGHVKNGAVGIRVLTTFLKLLTYS